MGVATMTMTETVASAPSTSKSVAVTLRSLYPRAARAFLHRDISLTHSLITSAFALLHPPPSTHDALHEHRRKWEILRITLEVTFYVSPPEDTTAMPAPLRSNGMLSGASLATALHTRSLSLFTPATVSKPDAVFLPAPVLVTLAAASVKVNASDVGRLIVEEWLAKRGQVGYATVDHEEDGYEKVIDVYCTSVLPALGEWEYAAEFMQYESELDPSSKERIVGTLASLHAQHVAATAAAHITPSSSSASLNGSASTSSSPTPTPSRPISPSSSSESISTTSTHTVVPPTPKGRPFEGLTPMAPTPRKSSQAPSAATSRTVTPISSARRQGPAPPFRVPLSTAPSSSQVAAPPAFGAIALLRHHLARRLAPSLPRLLAALLVLLVPLISILRRRRSPAMSSASGAVADVRRRLSAQKQANAWRTFWQEVVRAVGDTVRMGGRGLV